MKVAQKLVDKEHPLYDYQTWEILPFLEPLRRRAPWCFCCAKDHSDDEEEAIEKAASLTSIVNAAQANTALTALDAIFGVKEERKEKAPGQIDKYSDALEPILS